MGKLALWKQLDKESSSHAEHPRILRLWSLKLKQTWTQTLLLNEADTLFMVCYSNCSQQVGATYRHTGSTFICTSYYTVCIQVENIRPTSFMLEHTCTGSRFVVEKQVPSLLNNNRSYAAPNWASLVFQLHKERCCAGWGQFVQLIITFIHHYLVTAFSLGIA